MQNSQGALSMQLAQRDIIKYDLLKYRYIGNISRGETVLMVRKGLRDRLTDARAKPLVVPTKDGNESWQFLTMMGKEFLAWNVRWLLGYAGTNEMELALRRGEVDMLATSTAATVNRLVQEGHVELVTQVGMIKGGKFIRRSDFPNVPTFEETLGDRKPSGIPWQAYVVRVSAGRLDKFMVAPPGTPDNVMAILRGAFEKMSEDPNFDQMVRKTLSQVYVVGIGDEVLEITRQVLDAPPEALNYSTQLQKKFDIIK